MNASPDIFLSYNREDQAVAKHFAETFEAAGLSVWWDVTLRSGEAYDEVTENALHSAKAVVVLWSPRSVSSRWVRAEATVADQNKTLVPVTIEACRRPVMFELTQTADLSHWKGEAGNPAWLAFLGDVQRIVGQVASGLVANSVPKPAFDGSNIPSVAVLPLTHRANDEELEYLAEELTEEITRKLPRKGIFKVIAAGVVASSRDKAADFRALGRDLDARYVAEGKLQQSGDSVRLTLQLIDTSTGNMPWSKRFVRSRTHLDEEAEGVAADIAYELAEQILEAEMVRAMTELAPLSAWDHTLRAIAYSRRPGTDAARRGLEEARRALETSPDIALAHAFCVWGLAIPVAGHGKELNGSLSQEIQSHIDRAMQLDGDNPEVLRWLLSGYAALGECETNLRLAKHLVETEPYAANSWFWYGVANSALGRFDEAISAIQKYDSLATVDHIRPTALYVLSMGLLIEGRLVEAQVNVDRALALHPDFHLALRVKAIVEAHLGNEAQALATVRRLRRLDPDLTIDNHARALALTPNLAECTAEAVATLKRLWMDAGGD
jgi:TolB-like protein